MKFIHVYNEKYFEGLVKNGFINEDTGFKIQHAFSMEDHTKFNRIAAKDTKLYDLIKSGTHPFYVDRITGGITYHKYDFDPALIREYEDVLGKWFLGFQLHETACNNRGTWQGLIQLMGGKPPYDAKLLRKLLTERSHAVTPDGVRLPALNHGTPEEYAAMRYAETPAEYADEIFALFQKRMKDTHGFVLPCDSYYLLPKMENELGMRTFMPEVGCQIPATRMAVAATRGTAEANGKIWGTYYETWRWSDEEGNTMPCYNKEPGNEWNLKQENHGDDFTSFGPNGGSSRLLQRRIYYYSMMSGADYIAEEWGLNCSYSDMNTFELSPYGEVKKEFINDTRAFRGVKARVPMALVLPTSYPCVEIHRIPEIGKHRAIYMGLPITQEQQDYFGHIEDVLKMIYYVRTNPVEGNEAHIMTNTAFGDLFDIIYADEKDATLAKYEYLIDASPDGAFAKAKSGQFKVLTSEDLSKLAVEIHRIEKEILPITVDSLHWLLSDMPDGRRYLTIFNNEGNMRSIRYGDQICRDANARAKITLKEAGEIRCIKRSSDEVRLEKVDDKTYYVDVPATGFVILQY